MIRAGKRERQPNIHTSSIYLFVHKDQTDQRYGRQTDRQMDRDGGGR